MVFIKNVYGVDFSAEVLNSFSTVTLLAEKLKEAIDARSRSRVPSPFHESDDETEGKKDR